jgi:N-acetylmuramoyl-L-alanine amidase
MAKRLIFLSAGHSNGKGASKDRGAKVAGYELFEGDISIILRDKIADILREKGANVTEDKNEDALAQTFAFFRNLVNTNSINIDIHFNAATNPKATGTEVFVKSLDPKFAWQINIGNRFCEAIVDVLKCPTRGVKGESQSARGRLGWMQLTGHNFLLEICFISNSQEVVNFMWRIDDVASALANEIYLASLA